MHGLFTWTDFIEACLWSSVIGVYVAVLPPGGNLWSLLDGDRREVVVRLKALVGLMALWGLPVSLGASQVVSAVANRVGDSFFGVVLGMLLFAATGGIVLAASLASLSALE